MIQNVLIICVGNICRSPMGEAVFKEKLRAKSPEIVVSSAGLGALIDEPADNFAQELMLQRGLDISSHRARQVSSQILFDADIIFTMSAGQQKEIWCSIPSIFGKVHRLGNWSGYDIPDPYRRPKQAFEQALALIEQGIEDWCKKLWN